MPILQSDMQALIDAYDEANAARRDLIAQVHANHAAALNGRLDWYVALDNVVRFATHYSAVQESTVEIVERQRGHIQATSGHNIRRTRRARAKRGLAQAQQDTQLAAYYKRTFDELTVRPAGAARAPATPQVAPQVFTFEGTELVVTPDPNALQPGDLINGLDFEPDPKGRP